MFKKILIATDGSSHAKKAMEIGADLAGVHGAEVKLVHVVLSGEVDEDLMHMVEVERLVSPPVQGLKALAHPLASRLSSEEVASDRILHALGAEILERAAEEVKKRGVRHVTTRLMEGNVTEQLMKAIEEDDADLVVCGARGLSSFAQIALGSISAKISHLCPVTCVIVR